MLKYKIPQIVTLTLKKYKNTQSYILGCKKGCKSRKCLIYTLYCGETGIRTYNSNRLYVSYFAFKISNR